MANMDVVKEQLNNNIKKMNILEKFIALSLRRKNIEPAVNKCLEKMANLQQVMQKANLAVTVELDKVTNEYEKVMRRMKQQQDVIVHYMLNERRRKIQAAEAENRCIQGQVTGSKQNGPPNSALKMCSKSLALNFAQMSLNQNAAVTPKMTINEYKESPFVKRTKINPIPISFFEFECNITPELFDSIPKYMRGRETIDCLNNFLETVIIACFNEKYKLLHRQRPTVRHPADMELWKLYNEQVALVPGGHFITPGDISRYIQKMIDKKSQSRITMLRHLGILQERRIKSTVCYIWTARMDVSAHSQ